MSLASATVCQQQLSGLLSATHHSSFLDSVAIILPIPSPFHQFPYASGLGVLVAVCSVAAHPSAKSSCTKCF